MKKALISAMAIFSATTVSANNVSAGEQCWVSYDDFERMVPHTDLLTCPSDKISPDVGFCRLSLNGDTVTIYQFKFAEDDVLCLARARGYDVESFLQRYGTRYAIPE